MSTYSSVEKLEDRIAPAGLVTVTFDALHKSLQISGDAEANDVTVTQLALGTLVVIPNNGTQIVDAAGGAPGVNALIFKGVLGDVAIDLQAGDDILQIHDLRTVRDLTIANTGAGSDSITLTSVKVGRNLTGTGSDGHNNVTFTNLSVHGALLWTGGALADDYSIGGSSFVNTKSVRIIDAAGDNSLNVTAHDVLVSGFQYIGSSDNGSDTVTFEDSTFSAGVFSIDTGTGPASVHLHAANSWRVGHFATFYSNEHLTGAVDFSLEAPKIFVGQRLFITAGSGTTDIAVKATNLTIGNTSTITVAGLPGTASSVAIETATATLGTTVVTVGDGEFTLTNAGRMTVNGSFMVTSAGSTITTGLLAVTKDFQIYGSPEADTVVLDAAVTAALMYVGLGAGADSFTWTNHSFHEVQSEIRHAFMADLDNFIGGTATAGVDTFTMSAPALARIFIDGPFSINASDSGGNSDNIQLSGLRLAKGLTVTSADSKFSLDLNGVTVNGAMKIQASDALDATIRSSVFRGLVNILGGTNADQISIATDLDGVGLAPTTFARPVDIQLSTGADVVSIGSAQPLGHPIFNNKVTIDGGADTDADTINLGANAVFHEGDPVVTDAP